MVAGEIRALAARAADSARKTTALSETAADRGRAGEVEEQSRHVTQVATAMQQIDANAQSSSARSEQLSGTAAALREQSDLVGRSIAALARVAETAPARSATSHAPKRPKSPVTGDGRRATARPVGVVNPGADAELSFRKGPTAGASRLANSGPGITNAPPVVRLRIHPG